MARILGLILCSAMIGACGGGGGGSGSGNAATEQPASAGGSEPAAGEVAATQAVPVDVSIPSPLELLASGATGAGMVRPASATTGTAFDARLAGLSFILMANGLDNAVAGFVNGFSSSALGLPVVEDPCMAGSIRVYEHDDAPGLITESGDNQAIIGSVFADSNAAGVPCIAAQLSAVAKPMVETTNQSLLLVALVVKAHLENAGNARYSRLAPADRSAYLSELINAKLGNRSGAGGIRLSQSLVSMLKIDDTAELLTNTSLVGTDADNNTRFEVVATHKQWLPGAYLGNNAYSGSLITTVHRPEPASTPDTCDDVTTTVNGMPHRHIATVQVVRYESEESAVRLGARRARYCGGDVWKAVPAAGTRNVDAIAAMTTGDRATLDPNTRISGFPLLRDGSKGWIGAFYRFGAEYDWKSASGQMVLASPSNLMQYTVPVAPANDPSLIMAFDVSPWGAVNAYAGRGAPIATTNGMITGMLCNFTYGDAPRMTGGNVLLAPWFQSQVMQRSVDRTRFELDQVRSRTRFAPTNNCATSASMRFDAGRDGQLDIHSDEGASFSPVGRLDTMRAGLASVEAEIAARGFTIPSYF